MPFTPKTPEFIFENHLHDSKEWFHEHKADYEQYIKEPFKEFLEQISPYIAKIDPELSCEPKRLSRIYRDARYSKGQSIFRDYVWYTFSRARENNTSHPAFYFSVSPSGFDYGCGYYYTPSDTLAAIRSLILSGDYSFVSAKEAFNSQNVFSIGGNMYKKDHYPDEPEENKPWLNNRNIFFFCESKDFKTLYSKKLPQKIGKEFLSIAPIYNFFCKAEQLREQ